MTAKTPSGWRGSVRAAVTRDHAAALAAADRALLVCNNSALVLGFDALTRCVCGAYDEAIAHAEKAIRLSPLEPLIFYAEFALSLACLLTDRSDEAVANASKSLEVNRSFAFTHCVLALGLMRLGRRDEAAAAGRRLLELAPSFSIGTLRKIRFAGEQQMRANVELLRSLGIPG
jgi:adenylate cyclase